MNGSEAKNQLDKLNKLDNKLIDILSKTAEIMDSISSLSSATEAQELVNQKPEEFSKLLQEIRGEFFDIIETAPKPGIPYYDPKPLTDLKESLHNMEE